MSEYLRPFNEALYLREMWRLPATEPFGAIIDGFPVEDVIPLVGFYKGPEGFKIGYGVSIPSHNAKKLVLDDVNGVNLFLPLMFPHVIKEQLEINVDTIHETIKGIRYHLRHDVPNQQDSEAVMKAYAKSGRILEQLDADLVDQTALIAFSYDLPVDWEASVQHVKELELSPTPFIDSVSVS